MKTQILFVDDEPRILDGLRRSLRPLRDSWDMHFAGGGEQALAIMSTTPIDILVTDMCMPEMDGAELLRRVRSRHPATVRIVLSGQYSKQAGLRAVAVAHQFLPKPSDPDVLRSAVEHSLTVRSILPADAIRRAAGAVGALPFRPRTHAALLQVLNQPDVAMEAIAEVIERDVAVTAKILQVVNSALLGLPNPISSILSAVQLLGVDSLKQVVLSAEILASFRTPRRGDERLLEGLHQHSQLVAQIAGRLPLPEAIAAQSVMAALLHDIGKLVVACQMPERFCRLSAALEKGQPMIEAETEILGATHAEIGAYLLGLWGLPTPIVEAVLAHHQEAERLASMWTITEAVRIANALVGEAQDRACGRDPRPRPELSERRLESLGCAEELTFWREAAAAAYRRLPNVDRAA